MGSLGSEKELDQHAHKSIHNNDDDAVPPAAASTRDHERFAEQIHYFAPPHSTTLKHVLILIFYHMLPFTLIPTAMFCLEMYWVYKFLGWVGVTAVSAFLLFLAVAPPYYSKSIRRKTRPLYETLASYLPSAKYIVPKTPFPQDKAYIFAMHPHGRMFYANALFSQVHEIWREPIKLVQGTYATFQTAHDLLLFPILLIPVNCCLNLLGFWNWRRWCCKGLRFMATLQVLVDCAGPLNPSCFMKGMLKQWYVDTWKCVACRWPLSDSSRWILSGTICKKLVLHDRNHTCWQASDCGQAEEEESCKLCCQTLSTDCTLNAEISFCNLT